MTEVSLRWIVFFFFQAEDGIRDIGVTGVQTCALPIFTSTHIGEWARDKMTRFALLTRGGEPHLWDFGSAAKHHRLYCPWLPPENVRGGMIRLRGAVAPAAGLFAGAAREIAPILRDEGVSGMPLGLDIVEPPMLAALQAEGIDVRDGPQTLLDA